tara:strand:+ start:94374 stop:94514 length:141 start_codon:yes stop_codon:yes gene_type:complete
MIEKTVTDRLAMPDAHPDTTAATPVEEERVDFRSTLVDIMGSPHGR